MSHQQTSLNDTDGQWKHIPALDGLRGVAVLMVMMHHMFLTDVFDTPAWIDRIVHTGWMGVDLFFVLSGFLITGILLNAKETPNRFTNFYMRRVLRIFPLYYGTLALILFGLPFAVSCLPSSPSGFAPILESIEVVKKQQWRLWLYLQNFGGDWRMFNHLWSLAVEEHFYMVWPAAVFLSSRKRMFQICIGTILTAFLCRLVWIYFDIQVGSCYIFTLCRMDSLAMGGLCALLVRGTPTAKLRLTAKRAAMSSGLILGVSFLSFSESSPNQLAIETVGFTIIACFFASIVLITATVNQNSHWGWIMEQRALRACGRYSYAAYIFHRLIVRPLLVLTPPAKWLQWFPSPIFAASAFLVFASLVTFFVAFASWNLFEKHFLSLKKYFDYRVEPKLATESAVEPS